MLANKVALFEYIFTGTHFQLVCADKSLLQDESKSLPTAPFMYTPNPPTSVGVASSNTCVTQPRAASTTVTTPYLGQGVSQTAAADGSHSTFLPSSIVRPLAPAQFAVEGQARGPYVHSQHQYHQNAQAQPVLQGGRTAAYSVSDTSTTGPTVWRGS